MHPGNSFAAINLLIIGKITTNRGKISLSATDGLKVIIKAITGPKLDHKIIGHSKHDTAHRTV
jgi:hypothetical protein